MHHKRKKPRTLSDSQGPFPNGSRRGESPSHWNIIFHHRPGRRRDKENCRKAMMGDEDRVVWDLGNRKPHIYYW